jgi:hypothetical protein
LIDDPAKQICSDLATVCLPIALRDTIAQYYWAGSVQPFAAVRVKRTPTTMRLFVSPNGFAEYFGVPPRRISRANITNHPVVISHPSNSPRQFLRLLGIGILVSLALWWLWIRLLRNSSRMAPR